MKKIFVFDAILNIFIVMLCVIIPVCISFSFKGEKTVVVKLDGEQVQSVSLSTDTEVVVPEVDVTVKIDNGKAYISHSDCPDGLCMKMKKAENVGDSVICVPNRVSVLVVGDQNSESEVDIVAGQ